MATEITAKGDLIVGTGSATFDNLAAGSNGETLVADSSTSTGLRYQPSTGRNFALNSDFTIWQRGTTITPTTNGGAYCADRWFISRGSNTSITATQQTAGNLSVTPNQAFRYFARVQRTATTTTTSDVDFGQMFETSQVTLLAGQTVTLSGYIRKGANFSATSDALVMRVIEGTGTDQKQMDGGYTGQATVVTGTKTLTTSWQRFSVTGTIATTSTEITIKFGYTPTGTAGANDYFDIAGVQLELGSVPTAWNLATGTLQGELAACQRYYEKSYDLATVPGTSTFNGIYWASGSGASATTGYLNTALRYQVRKRGVPSVTFWDAVGNANACTRSTLGVGDNNNQSVTSGQIGETGQNVYSTGTSNTTFMFHYVASAEL
jgi:hypothetical protein